MNVFSRVTRREMLFAGSAGFVGGMGLLGGSRQALGQEVASPAQPRQRSVDAAGRPWETAIDGQSRWLLIHEFPVPDGYTVAHVSVALSIGATYPDTQIDMVYFRPALERSCSITSMTVSAAAFAPRCAQ